MSSTKIALVLVSFWALAALVVVANQPSVSAKVEPKEEKDPKRKADRLAIKEAIEKFADAFGKGDAKQVAALWTLEGEFVDDSGERMQGRAAIEKAFTAFFQKQPGSTVEIKQESLRFLSRDTAVEEGSFQVLKKDEKEATSTTRFSALYVREDGQWWLAVLREVEGSPAVAAKLSDLEWLIGNWTYKTKDREVHLHYTWSANKSFIHLHFQSKEGDKIVSSGLQIIGRDPVDDVIRSWVFNNDGGYGHAHWTQEKNRWIIDSAARLINGTESSSTNILTKLSNDTFTWQSVNRRLNGEAQPDTTPTKVLRVKSSK